MLPRAPQPSNLPTLAPGHMQSHFHYPYLSPSFFPSFPTSFWPRIRIHVPLFLLATTPPRPPPHPARRRLQPDPEALRQPYQELSAVPHLHSVRFELDLHLLMRTPLHIITVTLPVSHIEDEPYSVDDLKDAIYSRTGLPRCSFWLGLPALQDYTISQVPYTLSLEDLVFYHINIRQTRPPGHGVEFPRPLGTPGSLPYRDPELTAQTWAAPPRLHDDAGQQLRISMIAFPCQYEIWTFW